uniref:Cytochrome P450 n=1 Tax=Romanomermis culicivorax TaxID=13658 RepID=A0A915I915_ROMCU
MDLFVAGFITVMETFMWSLTCMAKFPHVQEKVQKELDDNLEGRFPTVDDRPHTPYTDATILEIFRFSSLTPFSLPHAIAYDSVFEGNRVSKLERGRIKNKKKEK